MRPAWAEIDLGAIRHNVQTIRSGLTSGCAYMAVVKANAYGHGDVEVARAALEGGASWLGVILPEEAFRLRDAGIRAPILMLHEAAAGDLEAAIANRVTPTVFTVPGAEAIVRAAKEIGGTIDVHLKVDTGLNRLGAQTADLPEVVSCLSESATITKKGVSQGINVQGFFSHFAIAEEPAHPDTVRAVDRFARGLERLGTLGIHPSIRHIGSSASALAHHAVHLDMVRVGISTYGIAPAPSLEGIADLRPAMSLKARVAMVKRVAAGEGVSYGLRYRMKRESTIATIPLGYADGWPRHATGRTKVLIRGRRYPVVGAICMDSFMVDLGEDTCEIGGEVVLIGTQGAERITASDVASQLGTIPYEVVTGITSRVDRVFV